MIHLPQTPEYWGYKHEPPHPTLAFLTSILLVLFVCATDFFRYSPNKDKWELRSRANIRVNSSSSCLCIHVSSGPFTNLLETCTRASPSCSFILEIELLVSGIPGGTLKFLRVMQLRVTVSSWSPCLQVAPSAEITGLHHTLGFTVGLSLAYK